MSEQAFITQWNNPQNTILILHSSVSVSVIVAAEGIEASSSLYFSLKLAQTGLLNAREFTDAILLFI
jgi:hypothetical protein